MGIRKYEHLDYSIYYKEVGYEKRYYPLLNEFFSRQKYEFEMTDEEIREKLDNLLENVEKIQFKRYIGSIAEFSPDEKSIRINKNEIKGENLKDFFPTLTHELYHACGHKNDQVDGMYDLKLNKKNKPVLNLACTCFDEVVTELKANRTTENEKDRVDRKGVVNTSRIW